MAAPQLPCSKRRAQHAHHHRCNTKAGLSLHEPAPSMVPLHVQPSTAVHHLSPSSNTLSSHKPSAGLACTWHAAACRPCAPLDHCHSGQAAGCPRHAAGPLMPRAAAGCLPCHSTQPGGQHSAGAWTLEALEPPLTCQQPVLPHLAYAHLSTFYSFPHSCISTMMHNATGVKWRRQLQGGRMQEGDIILSAPKSGSWWLCRLGRSGGCQHL